MAYMTNSKRATRVRHHLRASNGENRLRLSVSRSNDHIYVQVIDDAKGETLASASTMDKKLRKDVAGKGGTMEAARTIGTEIAKRAKAKGVEKVYFDRGGRRYHGRIKALADAAREGGLNF